MLKLKEEMDVVRQTSEETLQESQTIRKEVDVHKVSESVVMHAQFVCYLFLQRNSFCTVL